MHFTEAIVMLSRSVIVYTPLLDEMIIFNDFKMTCCVCAVI